MGFNIPHDHVDSTITNDRVLGLSTMCIFTNSFHKNQLIKHEMGINTGPQLQAAIHPRNMNIQGPISGRAG